MSDERVQSALRSQAQLVVIEAPAGCGKTHQGADYAREIATEGGPGLPLIVTHTHAACSVFAERTKAARGRVEICTIDSVIAQIAAAYHVGLDLTADIAGWVRENKNGHQELAIRVAKLLKSRTMIAAALARRHPVVICDEHQDSSGDQHAIVMALLEQGAKVRVFTDPMQKIFKEGAVKGSASPCDWEALRASAQVFERLDHPHRWDKGCPELGQWTLNARERLKANERIDLRGELPTSLSVVYADNLAQKKFGYQLESQDRKELDRFLRETRSDESILILTHYNDTASSLRSFFWRQVPLWEGYVRSSLEVLVNTMNASKGDVVALAEAIVAFMAGVGKGFSPSAFGDAFVKEVRDGCAKARKGKPALVQELAQLLVNDPSHRGVAKVLCRLQELRAIHKDFKEIEIDCQREFWEAIRLAEFDTPDDGLVDISHRRTYSRPKPPSRAISSIHKAKGLESDRVLLLPCDSTTFPDKLDARCLLYVALSRARRRLMIVVSRNKPSPLFVI